MAGPGGVKGEESSLDRGSGGTSHDIESSLSALELASQSGAFSPSPADSLRETLDDEDIQRGMSMAQLKAQLERERANTGGFPSLEGMRPRARDDELLSDPPRGDYHLGRLGGWRSARKLRWFIGVSLSVAVLVGLVVTVSYQRELSQRRLHPLPELEALISPDTPREMNLSDGHFRVGLGREAPAVNVIHLPDRDISLAGSADKAQLKVEIREGKTVMIKVLTGEVKEALTAAGAEPLL